MGQIRVLVPLHGDAVISVNGVPGRACKDLTAGVEKALGEVLSDTETREMEETASELTHEQEA